MGQGLIAVTHPRRRRVSRNGTGRDAVTAPKVFPIPNDASASLRRS
jgi:hypothetical protein